MIRLLQPLVVLALLGSPLDGQTAAVYSVENGYAEEYGDSVVHGAIVVLKVERNELSLLFPEGQPVYVVVSLLAYPKGQRATVPFVNHTGSGIVVDGVLIATLVQTTVLDLSSGFMQGWIGVSLSCRPWDWPDEGDTASCEFHADRGAGMRLFGRVQTTLYRLGGF